MSYSTVDKKKVRQNPLPPLGPFFKDVAKTAGITMLGATTLVGSVVAGGLLGLAISFRNLPDVRLLNSYVPKQTSHIYDIKGRLIDTFHGEENRKLVKLDEISPHLKLAVLAIEDSHFYQHQGINPNSILRALRSNLREGEVVEGASTLTMQLVKNLFLTQERTFNRKLPEAVLAIRLEQVFNKDEILEIYLNNIYWGHNNYGVQTAAESYFGKSAAELTLAEAAMMAGLIQAPEKYSPFINYQITKARQKVVLRRLRELGWISAEQEKLAFEEPLLLAKPTAWVKSELPYVTDAVTKELELHFTPEVIEQGGMYIQTTVDYDLQRMAEVLVRQEQQKLRAQGVNADQIALVAIDPRTHFVKVLVGGTSYDKTQFNRATQANRQPGSSFKPFVYYAALATGKYKPDTILEDTKVIYEEIDGPYEPKNYDEEFAGKISLEQSLIYSRNIPVVKLGQTRWGSDEELLLDRVIEVSRALGIKSELIPITSLPLGSLGVTPMEMAGAYATFASNGWHSDTTMIVRVTNTRGELLLDNSPKPRQVLDPWATATLNVLLQKVITQGTGMSANIDRPAAGKTGTTSSERDVWFVGYVPQLATAVWVGNDQFEPLGEDVTGGQHAAPIWRQFMINALKDEPVQEFLAPDRFPVPVEEE
ncbi:transglycosylase domain-containing protein [Gloeocapsa sp. PCC 73106]|uniref:transglycosylase domain-containing protein n=1 Tax=Gloeocapsa sp. PCC 73106 TaxID=102232 RepID=UPI0002AC49DD|nr:penicillin-binding protein, 1A family [Gloeocapsa sp. PCC 73106]